MALQVNLNDIFEGQFGFRPKADEIEIDGNDSRIVNVRSDDKWYKADPEDLYGRSVFMPVTINGLFLPYCWMTIRGSKKIIMTDLTERRGSVKEFVSEDDLRINIKGFVLTRDGKFPEAKVEELRDLWRVNAAVDIDCPLTDIFLLTNETGAQDQVVITDWRLLDNKGVEHVKGFEMNLVTDQELELEIA